MSGQERISPDEQATSGLSDPAERLTIVRQIIRDCEADGNTDLLGIMHEEQERIIAASPKAGLERALQIKRRSKA